MFFYEYSCGHMCICSSMPACANIPLQPRHAPAAECPGAPAGTDLEWPAAARGWCRENQWSPLSAPPSPQAGCPRSGVTTSTSSPAGTPHWTAGEGGACTELKECLKDWREKKRKRKRKDWGGNRQKFYKPMSWNNYHHLLSLYYYALNLIIIE